MGKVNYTVLSLVLRERSKVISRERKSYGKLVRIPERSTIKIPDRRTLVT